MSETTPDQPVAAAALPPSVKTDVVAIPSLRADGTPDQTEGFVAFAESLDHAQERQAKVQDSEEKSEVAFKAVVAGEDPATSTTDTDADADAEPKGEALDQALRDAGLPLTGSADEKRARLAESQAS